MAVARAGLSRKRPGVAERAWPHASKTVREPTNTGRRPTVRPGAILGHDLDSRRDRFPSCGHQARPTARPAVSSFKAFRLRRQNRHGQSIPGQVISCLGSRSEPSYRSPEPDGHTSHAPSGRQDPPGRLLQRLTGQGQAQGPGHPEDLSASELHPFGSRRGATASWVAFRRRPKRFGRQAKRIARIGRVCKNCRASPSRASWKLRLARCQVRVGEARADQ